MLDSCEQTWQLTGDDGFGSGAATAVEHHKRERVRPISEQVHEGVLVNPEDLAHDPLDPVSNRLRAEVASGREADLKRRSVRIRRDDTVPNDERPDADHLYIVARTVEQRTDEALALEPSRARERVTGGVVAGRRQRRVTCPASNR